MYEGGQHLYTKTILITLTINKSFIKGNVPAPRILSVATMVKAKNARDFNKTNTEKNPSSDSTTDLYKFMF